MSYEQMSDDQLRMAIAEKMCRVFKSPEIFNPFDDARDVQTVKDWAWEKHEIEVSVFWGNYVASALVMSRLQINVSHDGTRESRHRAEARATIIAVLKAVEAKEPTR